jgi:hypothetical protein
MNDSTIPSKVQFITDEKALGRTLIQAATPSKPGYDGDGDGFMVNPATGEDNVPFKKPNVPDVDAKPEKPKSNLLPKPEKKDPDNRFDNAETEEIFKQMNKEMPLLNKLKAYINGHKPMSTLPSNHQRGSGQTAESHAAMVRSVYQGLLKNQKQMKESLKNRGYEDPDAARIEYGRSKTKAKSLPFSEMLADENNQMNIRIVKDDEDAELEPRQRIMYEFYELIAKKMGKWSQDTGPDGAHYAEENPFGKDGMKCINCSFFQGGNRCEVVTGEIDPEAICKLWIIRKDLLKEG